MKLTWLLFVGLSVGEAARKGSLVAYWGQNSYGASDGGGGQRKEHPLQDYCRDDTYDVLVMSFLTKFNADDPNGFPELNLGEHCKGTYEGTNHPKCDEVAEGIKFCQKQGKRVLLSMGGFNGDYTIATKSEADSLAYRMWGLYFGGTAEHRPFLDAVLDGVDLDIEKGPPENYAQFSTTMHNVFANNFFNPSNRTFVVTAAPQCPFPDAHLKNTLENGWLDMVFVQFYNNPCGLGSENFNLATWDGWARFASVNKEAKIFIGAPAAPTAATTGYMPHTDLKGIIKDASEKYPSFGGIMLWDVSQANMNLCPNEKKLFSVAISHTLKGQHIVSQPGALAPEEATRLPTQMPNLKEMVPATLPKQDPSSPKQKPEASKVPALSRNSSSIPTPSPVITKIEAPKSTAETISDAKPSAAPSEKQPSPKPSEAKPHKSEKPEDSQPSDEPSASNAPEIKTKATLSASSSELKAESSTKPSAKPEPSAKSKPTPPLIVNAKPEPTVKLDPKPESTVHQPSSKPKPSKELNDNAMPEPTAAEPSPKSKTKPNKEVDAAMPELTAAEPSPKSKPTADAKGNPKESDAPTDATNDSLPEEPLTRPRAEEKASSVPKPSPEDDSKSETDEPTSDPKAFSPPAQGNQPRTIAPKTPQDTQDETSEDK